MMDQQVLLTRISRGDRSAFDTLYKNYRPFIYAFFLHYVRQTDLAEDLCQELFIKIWEKRSSLADIQSLKAYLRVVAKNLALNTLKKMAHAEAASKELSNYISPNGYESTYLHIQDKEYFRLLKLQLDKLPRRSREIFLLCREEGKSYAEAAEETGVSRSSIKHHMIESLRFLKTFVEKHLDITVSLVFSFLTELFL